MARLILFKNIFDLSDADIIEDAEGKKISEVLSGNGLDCGTYPAMAEVYNPDTGETEMCPMLDDSEDPLNLGITVNGKNSPLDYVLTRGDVAKVFVVPAKDAGHTWAVIGGVLAIVAGVALAAFTGGSSLGLALALGVPLIMGGVAAIAWGLMDPKEKNSSSGIDYEETSQASISSSSNQLLEDAFPIIIGKISCKPGVVGSLYNEFIIDMGSMKTRFGSRQIATELLAVGYAPVFLKDIKFGELIAVRNKNNILSGLLSHETVIGSDGKKVAALNGQPITFDGKESGYEVEAMWNTNRVRMEISQFGNHRTIYPFTVKQENFSVPLLYCYDEEYREVAGERNISWMGREFPTGMRNATIKFSENVPYRLSVGIDFPGGLFRTHTTSEGTQVFTKIPMNLIIQWRPVYRYASKYDENPDRVDGANEIYRGGDVGDTYSEMRYRGWRNFTESPSGVPYTLTYTGGPKRFYYTYSLNGIPAKQNGCYGFFVNNSGYSLSGVFHPVTPVQGYGDEELRLAIFTAQFVSKSLDASQVELMRRYTDKHGRVYLYDYYFSQPPQTTASVILPVAGISDYVSHYREVYDNLPYQSELSQMARAQSWTPSELDSAWAMASQNFMVSDESYNMSRNEVRLNKGLSSGTSETCNPNWEGAECWSFGRASCGYKAAESNFSDPSLVDTDISFTDAGIVAAAKNEMRFEVSVTLSKEDILDLIGRNPKSKVTGNNSPLLMGMTDTEIDSVEVRVLRLTPCYIEGKDGSVSYTYSDVVKWSYLKTYCVDRQKLLDDIDNLSETVTTTNPGTGETEAIKVSRIDCNPKTYRQTGTWLNWNVEDYRSIPVSQEDMGKLALLAVEAEADPLGQLNSTLEKIALTGYAVTPALLGDWTRWWYTDGTDYWYRDGYESSGTRKISLRPSFSSGNPLWIKSDAGTFNADASVSVGNGYYYSQKDRQWDEEMFPKKIEPKNVLQLKTDAGGRPVYNDRGQPVTEVVRQGNGWIDYISRLMSEFRDSAGRWVATDSFLEAFTDRNAISQALGFLVGQSLGREPYWYNAMSRQKFVRYWKETEAAGVHEYWTADTDLAEHDGTIDLSGLEWKKTTEEYWRATDRTDIGNGFSYSMRRPGSSFNMLTVREALRFTDAIDIGGSYGPMPYRCNMYVTSQQKVQQLLQTILVCGRAFWIYDELGRLEFFNDKERKTPVLMLTDENIISSSYTRSFKKGIAGYHGTFQDENNDFRQGEVYCLREGQTRDSHTRDIVDMSLQGVTDPKQFWCLLSYMLGLSITQREAWELKLTHVGNTLAVGSMVEFQSSVLEIGTDMSGRIAKIIEKDGFIYGFIIDRTYEYRGEYGEDGRNVQGLSIFQARAKSHSKIVTMRFASRPQQDSGITIGNETYSNMKGQTNLVLLEKRISVEDESLDGGPEGVVYTQYIPSEGDVVAFGNVGMTTQKGIVYQLQYDEKQRVTASLYPYFPEVYRSADHYPVYRTGMTKKSRSQDVVISMEATRADLLSTEQTLRSEQSSSITGLENGSSSNIGNPLPVRNLSAEAEKDGVDVRWLQPNGSGLANTISHYVIEVSKDGGTTWTESGKSSSLSYLHPFDRTVDGYPEYSAFSTWRVRVTAVNVYGGESTKVMQPVGSDGYGTWILPVPTVSVLHSSNGRSPGRTFQATLEEPSNSSGRILYGNIRWQVQVRRPRPQDESSVIPGINYDADGVWRCPATSSDPYASDDNYMDAQGTSVECGGAYIQTLPLAGQSGQSTMIPTYYEFRFRAVSDAPSAKWSQWSSSVGFTATISDIYDFVRANKTVQQEIVESLSAISANLGEITQGSMSGNNTNYWTLTTKRGAQVSEQDPYNKSFEGAFRVGNAEQGILVVPIVENGVVVDYFMTFKAGQFEISSTTSKLQGNLIVQDKDDSLERALVSPDGIYFQSRETPDGTEWTDVARQNVSGTLSRMLYSTDSMIISNQSIAQRRASGLDLGFPYLSAAARVYHFDDTMGDQNGDVGYTLDYPGEPPSCVGRESNGTHGSIDFTPAIRAVAPYAEIGRSLYGQYSLSHPLPGTVWTCDFWIQYLWGENQTLLETRCGGAVLTLGDRTAEPNYNEQDTEEPPYNFETGYTDMLTYNVARDGYGYIAFESKGQRREIQLPDLGIAFKTGMWLHIAVTRNGNDVTLMLASEGIRASLPFHIVMTRSVDAITLNPSRGSFLLDELYVDSVEENGATFDETSTRRIPWGSLDGDGRHFIIAMDPRANFATNVPFARHLELDDSDFDAIFPVGGQA